MRKYIKELLLFVILALTLNIIFQYILLKDREPLFFKIKSELSKQNDFILFGSSVNGFHKSWWPDKRYISEIVDSLCPEINLTAIWRSSASVENYYNYLNYSIKCNNIPKLIILPINIRAFTFEWSRPEYSALIAKERIFLNYGVVPYIFRNFIPKYSREINEQSHNKFYEEHIIVNGSMVGKVKDYIIEDKNTIKDSVLVCRKSFTLNYMSDITRTNPKIIYLSKIDSVCKEHNIQTLYYFTPIDYTSGNKYLPEVLTEKLHKQNLFFKKFMAERNNTILDLMFSLDSTNFQYELLPNEHLRFDGKYFLAEQISKELKKQSIISDTQK